MRADELLERFETKESNFLENVSIPMLNTTTDSGRKSLHSFSPILSISLVPGDHFIAVDVQSKTKRFVLADGAISHNCTDMGTQVKNEGRLDEGIAYYKRALHHHSKYPAGECVRHRCLLRESLVLSSLSSFRVSLSLFSVQPGIILESHTPRSVVSMMRKCVTKWQSCSTRNVLKRSTTWFVARAAAVRGRNEL